MPEKMDLDAAIKILGTNRTRDGDLRQMVIALKLLPALNTAEENLRLAAGNYVLRHWDAYAAECNRRRDVRLRVKAR